MWLLSVALLICVQVARFDLLFSPVSGLANQLEFYDPAKATELTSADDLEILQPHILVVYRSTQSAQVNNIKETLSNLHLRFETMLMNESRDDYSDIDIILMLDSSYDNVADWEKTKVFVENGGKLIYLNEGKPDSTSLVAKEPEFFGINWIGEYRESNVINLNTELLSGATGTFVLSGYTEPPERFFREFDVDLLDGCQVHMSDETGNPMIWEYDIDNGKVMFLSMGHYETKIIRGLLTGAISIVSDLLAYPIIDSTVIFIDDFPADYRSTPEIIAANYGRSYQRFILEIWWPDMRSFLSKYGLKYTTAFIETYNDQTSGSFASNTGIADTMQRLVRDVLNNKGEIAFHGYNHQPLFLDQSNVSQFDYKAWSNKTSMVTAIQSCVTFFNGRFPDYRFYTYVPPSNLLESKMIPVLKQSLPDLRTISGIYYPQTGGQGDNNQSFCIQEYSVDRQGIAYLPRVSAGASLTDMELFSTASVVTSNGIISHFIHPDDILDPDRSEGLLWEDMSKEYDNMFAFFKNQYGWLKNDTASVAAEKLRKAIHADLYYIRRSTAIEIDCNHFSDELPILVISKENLAPGSGYELQKIDSLRYLVILHQDKVLVGFQSE